MEYTKLCFRHGLDTAVNLPPNMFNRASPTIVLVLVEEVLQYFMDNPNADTMPVFLTEQAHSGTETVFIRLSTFVPHFLPPHFLSSREQDAKGNTKTDSDSACTAGLTPGMQSLGGLAEGF